MTSQLINLDTDTGRSSKRPIQLAKQPPTQALRSLYYCIISDVRGAGSRDKLTSV